MTLAILGNVLLALSLAAVVVTLLAMAIVRSPSDHRRVAAARRRQVRDHRRAARPRTSWTARTDGS
jgi:Tfp pilus assembly protein PilX